MNEPIEDYLDELYRRPHDDPRTARRLLDEAADHLHDTAAQLQQTGMDRIDAEREAVRRFGPSAPLVRADSRTGIVRLTLESGRMLAVLSGIGLVAVGLSGLVVAAMIATAGPAFVYGQPDIVFPGATSGPVIGPEVAQDAVSLRVLAGLVGIALLGVVLVTRLVRRRSGHRPTSLLPAGLQDTCAAGAFGVATLVLGAASGVQAAQRANLGIGFLLSGAIVSLLGAVVFGGRAARVFLRSC